MEEMMFGQGLEIWLRVRTVGKRGKRVPAGGQSLGDAWRWEVPETGRKWPGWGRGEAVGLSS